MAENAGLPQVEQTADGNRWETVIQGAAVTVLVRPVGDNESVPINFVIGEGQTQLWLEEAVIGLKRGDSVEVPNGNSNGLPVRVTVDAITTSTDGISPNPSTEELDAQAEKLRITGNDIFKKNTDDFKGYKSAILAYHSALDYNRKGSNSVDFEVRVRLNLALSFLRTCEWTSCISQCDAVLALKEDSAKAYFRRAQASIELDAFVRAISDLQTAHQICPDDPVIKKEMLRVTAEAKNVMNKRRKSFAEVYSVMPQSPIFSKNVLSM